MARLKPYEELKKTSGARVLKTRAFALLTSDDWPGTLEELLRLPRNQVVNPLISFLLHKNELVRWRAVIAIGAVVAALANEDTERARIIMRRFMWTLNDESGGIGWGAPESMAEIMVRNENLAKEYAPVLVSYLNPDGNYLEYEPLQRGLLWGLVRLAQVRPELVSGAAPFVEAYLDSGDSTVRGLASLAAGMLMVEGVRGRLASLLADDSELRVYADEGFQVIRVKNLAEKALTMLGQAPSQ